MGVGGRPALSTWYPTDICRGLLPSPINVARKAGGREGTGGKKKIIIITAPITAGEGQVAVMAFITRGRGQIPMLL